MAHARARAPRLVRAALEAGLPLVSPQYLINWVAHPWTAPLPASLHLHAPVLATPATVRACVRVFHALECPFVGFCVCLRVRVGVW